MVKFNFGCIDDEVFLRSKGNIVEILHPVLVPNIENFRARNLPRRILSVLETNKRGAV